MFDVSFHVTLRNLLAIEPQPKCQMHVYFSDINLNLHGQFAFSYLTSSHYTLCILDTLILTGPHCSLLMIFELHLMFESCYRFIFEIYEHYLSLCCFHICRF